VKDFGHLNNVKLEFEILQCDILLLHIAERSDILDSHCSVSCISCVTTTYTTCAYANTQHAHR